MELIRGGMKNALTTDWVTTSTATGTGTTQLYTGYQYVEYPTFDVIDFAIQLEVYLEITGGTGDFQAQPMFYNTSHYSEKAASQAQDGTWQSGYVQGNFDVSGTSIVRPFIVKLPLHHDFRGSWLGNQLRVRLRAWGTAVDTGVSAYMKARLLYVPI